VIFEKMPQLEVANGVNCISQRVIGDTKRIQPSL
jgi:hypothetical protein